MSPQLSQLIFPVALIAAFWFFLIRPQQRRQKEQAEMLSELAVGTEIVTIGGIFGTIVEAGEERLRIRVADGSELEIARRAVGSVVAAEETAAAERELESADADDDSAAADVDGTSADAAPGLADAAHAGDDA